MNKDIRNFIRVGKIEGYSYLILLFVAMPAKYFFHKPELVKITGSIHGILFVAFIFMGVWLFTQKHLNLIGFVKAFVLSLIPFGTFFLHKLFDSKNPHSSH